MDAYLSSTAYCDSHHPQVDKLLSFLARGLQTDRDIAVAAFNWVRDNIKYTVGKNSSLASQTLDSGEGSCSNKANLYVALLRAAGIPAAFRVFRVKTREYFGPLNSHRFSRFMSESSVHVFSSVFLDGRWLAADASDDKALSESSYHLNPPCKLVEFNGYEDAYLNLDPETITHADAQLFANIDGILGKASRIPGIVVEVINMYIDFIRAHALRYDDTEVMCGDFFAWLERSFKTRHGAYCDLERQLQSQAKIPASAEMPRIHTLRPTGVF